MIINNKYNLVKKITAIYFLIGLLEITAEYFQYKPFLYFFKPLIPILLMVLYYKTSCKKSKVYFIILLFSMITNILFIPADKKILFFGIIAFTVHRILFIYLAIKLLKIKDFVPILLATIPFFLIFSYLLSISENIPKEEFYLLILHNLLISILGGIAVSNYFMKESYTTSWLLICVLFFITLQFVVFIEKFYLTLIIFRPIAMTLNVLAFYCFYRFVIETEKTLNNN